MREGETRVTFRELSFPFLRYLLAELAHDEKRRLYSLNSPLLGLFMKSPSSIRSPSARGAAERGKKDKGGEVSEVKEAGWNEGCRNDLRAEGSASISSAHDPSSDHPHGTKTTSVCCL